MDAGNYLMLKMGGKAVSGKKSIEQSPIWLRFNVENVVEVAQALRKKYVDVKVRKEVWATVADFTDPDGYICSLRNESKFEK